MNRGRECVKKQRWLWLLVLLLSLFLIGCGGKSGQEKGSESSSVGKQEEKTEKNKEKQVIGKVEGFTEQELKAVCGDWSSVGGTLIDYAEDGTTREHFKLASDDESAARDFVIYVEDGKLFADFKDVFMRYYHVPVVRSKEKLYEGFERNDWCLVGKKGHWEDPGLRVALNDKQELISYSKGEEEDGWQYRCLFLKAGSENAKQLDDYRYTRVVTVSTAEELAAAIASRTKIILKPGTYDLTSLKVAGQSATLESYGEEISVDGFYFDEVENLCIEAESKELTELYITDAYRPVLPLYHSQYIKLRGLTLGHRIEPGYCSGSVLSLEQCEAIELEGCKLYGSGTYGLETYYTYGLSMKDSEIYGCTYGIMNLRAGYNLTAENCDFHDNSGYTMLSAVECANVELRNCRFRNNDSDTDAFVSLAKSWGVSLKKCDFEGNRYSDFVQNDPEDNEYSGLALNVEDCTFRDKR